MSQKNYASYGDMETLIAEIASKCGPYTEITYEDWLQLTPYQQEHGRWDVTGVPGADGTISIDLMTKLWENPDPTADFAPGNIQLSSTDFDIPLIVGRYDKNHLDNCPSVVGNVGYIVFPDYSSGPIAIYRKYIISGNTVTFSNALYNGTVNNKYCIPYQIYGIKLHHTVEIKTIAPTVSTLAKNSVFNPTGTDLESTNAEDAIKELESNFQDGVDAVYDAVVAKGSTPASHSLSDVVAGIGNIETGITPTGTIKITSNGTHNVTNYASASVAVPNSNSGTYTPTAFTTAADMGATNSYRYVNTTKISTPCYYSANWYSEGNHTTSLKVVQAGTYYIFAAVYAPSGKTWTFKQGNTQLHSGTDAWYYTNRTVSANTTFTLSVYGSGYVIIAARIGG